MLPAPTLPTDAPTLDPPVPVLPEPCVPQIDRPGVADAGPAVDPHAVPTLPSAQPDASAPPVAADAVIATPTLPGATTAPPAPDPAAAPAIAGPAAEPALPTAIETAPPMPTIPGAVPVVPVVEAVPVIDIAPALGHPPAPDTDLPAEAAVVPEAEPSVDTEPESERFGLFDTVTDSTVELPAQDSTVPAFEMPSLPSIAATASAAAAEQSWEPDPAVWAPEPVAAPAKTRTRQRRSPVRSIAGTIFAAALAAGAGAGAHLGYDWYTAREDAPVAATTPDVPDDLAAWKQVDPPAIRYTDTATTIVTDLGRREVTAHRDLVSGSRVVSVAETSLEGETTTYEVELRDAEAFIRSAPDAPWAPTSVEEATAIIGDEGLTDVFTVSDLFPVESLPFASILESEELQLPLGAIRQQAIPTAGADELAPEAIDDPAVTPPADGAALVRPTQVWHFRVRLDTEAFRAAEGAAFEAWERQLGRAAGTHFDVWVDRNGIVRQLAIDAEGVRLTQRLVSAAPTSATFTTPQLVELPIDPALAADTTEPVES